ncbi:MAG: hypothetical protein ACE1ZP_04830, partial [Myxococcota bacterium]
MQLEHPLRVVDQGDLGLQGVKGRLVSACAAMDVGDSIEDLGIVRALDAQALKPGKGRVGPEVLPGDRDRLVIELRALSLYG